MAKKKQHPDIEDKFTLIKNPFDPSEGDHFNFPEELKDYPDNRVWTVVEGDSGDRWWCLTGYHLVNRLFYVVSEEAWTDEDSAIDYEY